MNKTTIKPYEQLNLKIYAYTLPEVPSHNGYVKVGDTNREVKKRVLEQVGTAGLNPTILFSKTAKKSDGTWFRDKSLHRFFKQNGINKKNFNNYADEWFYFNGEIEKAEILTEKYINQDYDEVQIDKSNIDYILRSEQTEAVQKTLDYYNSKEKPREFLWNAKPRFGKTLTSYDFARKVKAKNVLIITNRPAIANSWFEDFKKFISWQEAGMKFVSDTDALKNKAMSRKEFVEYSANPSVNNPSQIVFISLQDLKGAKFAGGEHIKLQWVSKLNWDLLIIDEAHEGIDTQKTDAAFDKINRNFTLHLSGTPFKALANNKFNENQIFNWSYLDEQELKKEWDYVNGDNPYENLPTLNLFTYQMSKIIEDRVSQGLSVEDTNVDYAFDLNEFFRVKENGKFEYEESVIKFLDNLSCGKFPFSTDKHREELNHTFWLLPRVNSAKALEKLLKQHSVFREYKIVLAAGDGISIDTDLSFKDELDFNKNEKSFDKVKKAISDNEKTITLSVGQLTTGVTIPEWSAVLMLSNIKSPSLYFQAAFRAQNPYEFTKGGKLFRKENAYIFDFAPERTLLLFDELANNLTIESSKTSKERKDKIKELLNFFPVIAEDERGDMHELDASEVLTIPMNITSTEVVKRGFISNLLFNNIAGVFNSTSPFKEILDKIKPEKDKRILPPRELKITDPMLDEDGNVDIPKEIVINDTKDIFGPEIYKIVEITDTSDRFNDITITEKIETSLEEGFDRLKERFSLNNTQTKKTKLEVNEELNQIVEKNMEEYKEKVKEIEQEYSIKIKELDGKEVPEKLEEIKIKCEEEKNKASEEFTEILNTDIGKTIETAVEKHITEGEEKKKKTTEDDVRDHLRGFARTIPSFLMAYGDDGTTLSNFEANIDKESFKDLTSITIEEFKKLRDGFEYIDEEKNNRRVPGLFNEVVFNSSVKEFFNTKNKLSNYLNDDITEDIFDYIPPQKTNQIFTPRKTVILMLDLLEENYPDIFSNCDTRFLDLYSKSGLYITEIVKRLNKGLKKHIPDSKDRIKWILEKQIYTFAPTNIIYNIVKNYIIADFEDIKDKNIVQFDLTRYTDEADIKEKIIQKLGGGDLKFDVIIGNPPYQEMDGGAGASARPLYHHFIDIAKELNPELISLIIPTRWYVGGKGLDSFREDMLTDKHLRELHDWLTPEDVFPNTNIRGGVCYFLWDKNYNNKEELTRVVTYENDKVINDIKRPMKIETSDIFIRDSKAIDILEKVIEANTETIDKYVSVRKPFGIESNFINDSKFCPTNKGLTNPIICYGRGKTVGYIEKEEVIVRSQWIDKWKVFTPRANNIGTELNDDNLNTFIGEPGSICTESYMAVGVELDLDKASAKNLSKYFTTKFVRFFHGLAKASQDATSRTYRFVPLQNFTKTSDIDWSVDIKKIDNQLYKKYKLSEEEINHIQGKIKDM